MQGVCGVWTVIISILLWGSAIGCGLMAGVYFAFSSFVMSALGRIDASAGIAAMTSINDVILRSAFMPLFFVTSIAALALLGMALPDLPRKEAIVIAVGAVVYLVGMFGCTVLFNVPLNDVLASAVATPGAAQEWARYLQSWTMWNHVRTLASTLATACFVVALVWR